MNNNEIIYSYCNNCKCETKHEIIALEKKQGSVCDGEIKFLDEYAIVKCCGCELLSFRKESSNSEGYNDETGEIDVNVSIFPHREYRGLEVYKLPYIVREIYKETCDAIGENNLMLAGSGLRSIVEAVCNYEGIKGKLAQKISKLASVGKISKKEAKYLHAIRFLGNDAVHEYHKPKIEQILIAMKIIESLLGKYALEEEAIDNLELPIEDYSEFKSLVFALVRKTKKKDFTIDELLNEAKANRRFLDKTQLTSFKQQLDNDVSSHLFSIIDRAQTTDTEPKYRKKE